MKTVDFSEMIAACDLKDGRCRQLIELMKVYEYSRSRAFLDFGSRSFTYENCNLLISGNHWTLFNQICMYAFRYKEMKMF